MSLSLIDLQQTLESNNIINLKICEEFEKATDYVKDYFSELVNIYTQNLSLYACPLQTKTDENHHNHLKKTKHHSEYLKKLLDKLYSCIQEIFKRSEQMKKIKITPRPDLEKLKTFANQYRSFQPVTSNKINYIITVFGQIYENYSKLNKEREISNKLFHDYDYSKVQAIRDGVIMHLHQNLVPSLTTEIQQSKGEENTIHSKFQITNDTQLDEKKKFYHLIADWIDSQQKCCLELLDIICNNHVNNHVKKGIIESNDATAFVINVNENPNNKNNNTQEAAPNLGYLYATSSFPVAIAVNNVSTHSSLMIDNPESLPILEEYQLLHNQIFEWRQLFDIFINMKYSHTPILQLLFDRLMNWMKRVQILFIRTMDSKQQQVTDNGINNSQRHQKVVQYLSLTQLEQQRSLSTHSENLKEMILKFNYAQSHEKELVRTRDNFLNQPHQSNIDDCEMLDLENKILSYKTQSSHLKILIDASQKNIELQNILNEKYNNVISYLNFFNSSISTQWQQFKEQERLYILKLNHLNDEYHEKYMDIRKKMVSKLDFQIFNNTHDIITSINKEFLDIKKQNISWVKNIQNIAIHQNSQMTNKRDLIIAMLKELSVDNNQSSLSIELERFYGEVQFFIATSDLEDLNRFTGLLCNLLSCFYACCNELAQRLFSMDEPESILKNYMNLLNLVCCKENKLGVGFPLNHNSTTIMNPSLASSSGKLISLNPIEAQKQLHKIQQNNPEFSEEFAKEQRDVMEKLSVMSCKNITPFSIRNFTQINNIK
jgi:hypothetical protein